MDDPADSGSLIIESNTHTGPKNGVQNPVTCPGEKKAPGAYKFFWKIFHKNDRQSPCHPHHVKQTTKNPAPDFMISSHQAGNNKVVSGQTLLHEQQIFSQGLFSFFF
jgi:hypothetical protein